MLNKPERACLVIADISGYTSYLSGTELDHAQDVLADLMEVVIGRFQPLLRLAKLEGDAIFTWAPEAEVEGSMFLDVLESTYFAFRRRVQSIERASTCRCNACALIPRLNLKFCAHNGNVARQRIAGQEELAGRDVIVVHRLLKNTVAETLGLHGYALLTADCVTALGLDPGALGLRPHSESYEHIGDVPGFVQDLEARWAHERQARRHFLTAKDADLTVTQVIPAPPPLAWEFITTPSGYKQLADDITRSEAYAEGRRGVGTTTHCVHGDGSSHMEEILDWRPFDYFTYLIKDPQMGQILITAELTPADGAAQLRYSAQMGPEAKAMMADPAQRAAVEQALAAYKAELEAWFGGVAQLAGKQVAEMGEALQAAEATRRRLAETAAHYWQSRESWVQDPAASSSASTS